MENKAFSDIIEEQQIRIPRIQRDYAQGRELPEVEEIRKQFVHDLMLTVKGKKDGSKLDFIYGSDRKGAFEPLDGQQRLTTLFLLHWVLDADLCDSNGQAKLTYETRYTSRAFCNELVRHNARQFVDEAAEKGKSPSELIRGRDWFLWERNFDPTVSSMLVMIDTICAEMDWNLDLDKCRKCLDSLVFNFLDLGQLGMSDELFIKMNARGKQLSSFDKMKSAIEEDLQKLQQEIDADGKPLADSRDEKDWRARMDGAWIDLFWQKYAAGKVSNENNTEADRLQAAQEAENRMKVFILRMIANQLFTHPQANDTLRFAAYNINAESLDTLLLKYEDELISWRNGDEVKLPQDCVVLDFRRLMQSIDVFWVQDKSGYKDVTELLPPLSQYEPGDKTYFDYFVAEGVSNDLRVIFYALLCYLLAFREQTGMLTDIWCENFNEWTRFVRNVFKNDNNIDRIDRQDRTEAAIAQVDRLINNLVAYLKENTYDVNKDVLAVRNFINAAQPDDYKGIGLNRASLLEEIEKANLKLSDTDWIAAIDEAERSPYLWGQIRCLLRWSDGDIQKFINYSRCLRPIVELTEDDDKKRYYLSMLLLRPDAWRAENRLYEFNKDRDNSLKRYLRRADQVGDEYGMNLKYMIDRWLSWDSSKNVREFFDHVITNTQPVGWISSFKLKPEIIFQAEKKRIFEEKGHVLLAQKKTRDSHCFDPVLLCANELVKEKHGKGSSQLNDSKSDEPQTIYVSVGNDRWKVSWGEQDDEYILCKNGSEVWRGNSTELLDKVQYCNTY